MVKGTAQVVTTHMCLHSKGGVPGVQSPILTGSDSLNSAGVFNTCDPVGSPKLVLCVLCVMCRSCQASAGHS